MAKVEFSTDLMQRTVIPNLNKTIDSLNVLIDKCAQLYVPSGFKYKDYLTSLYYNNKNIKKNIVSVKEWIYSSNTMYNNLIESIRQEARNLDNIKIGKKYSSIK